METNERNRYTREGQLNGTAVGGVVVLITGMGIATLVLIFVGSLGGQSYTLVEDDLNAIANHLVSGDAFTANNVTQQVLDHGFVQAATLTIQNASDQLGLGNFTIDYDTASVLLSNAVIPSKLYNGSALTANYTWGAVDVRTSIQDGIVSSFQAIEKTGDYMPIIVLAIVISLVLVLVLGATIIGGGRSSGTAL